MSIWKFSKAALVGALASLCNISSASAFNGDINNIVIFGSCQFELRTFNDAEVAYVLLSAPGGVFYSGGSRWTSGADSAEAGITTTDLASCVTGSVASEFSIILDQGANALSYTAQDRMGISFTFRNGSYTYRLEGASNTLSVTSFDATNFPPADVTAPSVVSISRKSPTDETTNADSLTFAFTFSEDVQNFDASDVTVTHGPNDATVNVTGSDAAYDVTLSGGSMANFNGVVRLAVKPGSDIQDLAGNALNDVSFPTPHMYYTLSNAVAQTISFPPPSNMTYGNDRAIGASSSSLLPISFTSDTPTVCTVEFGFVTILKVGNCTINANQPGNADYLAAAEVSRTFAIIKRPLTITADTQSKTYGSGAALDNTAFSITGGSLATGEGITTVEIVSNGNAHSNVALTAQPYVNNLSISSVETGSGGFDANNYDITFVAGDYTINKRPITLTPNTQSRDYGDELQLDGTAFTIGGDGMFGDNRITSVDLVAAADIATRTNVAVGTYDDHLSISGVNGSGGFDESNYDITYAKGDFNIRQRDVKITANAQQKVEGTAHTLDNTAFVIADKGALADTELPNSETIDTVNISSTGGRDADVNAGADTYFGDLVISGVASGSNGFLASNYNFLFINGDYSVIDEEAPTVLVGELTSTGNGTYTATIEPSEEISNLAPLEANELIVGNGTATLDGNLVATVTPSGDGVVTLQVPAGAFRDTSGNENTASNQVSVIHDTGAPTVQLSQLSSVGNGFYQTTVSISEPPSGNIFELSDLVVTNGTATFRSGRILRFVKNAPVGGMVLSIPTQIDVLIEATEAGLVTVNVPSNAITDAAGRPNAASNQVSTIHDGDGPTVAITAEADAVLEDDLQSFTALFIFSEDVSVVDTFEDDFKVLSIAENGISNDIRDAEQRSDITSSLLSGINAALQNAVASDLETVKNSTAFSATITPDGKGDVSIGLKAGAVQDENGNGNVEATPLVIPLIGEGNPTVKIEDLPETTNGADPFIAKVVFSADVTGFGLDDVEITGAALSDLVMVSASEYTIVVTPSGGEITLSVLEEAAQDEFDRGNAASIEYKITEDADAPVIVSIERETDETTSDDELSWIVTFSEPVSGFDSADLDIEGVEGNINVTVEPISEEASLSPWDMFNTVLGVTSAHAQEALTRLYRVTVSGGNIADDNVTVILALAPSSTIADSSGNSLVSTTPTGVNEGEIVVVNDTTSPSVEVAGPTETKGPFTVTFTFTEPVTGFDASDVVTDNATLSNLKASDENGGFASVFTATATPIEHGTVTINVNGNAAADAAGNLSLASDTLIVTYIDVSYVQTRTGAVINNFLNRRANNVLANEPDLSGRLTEQGGIGATEQFAFRAEGTEGQLSVDFGGSLTRQRLTSPLALGYGANAAETPGAGGLQKFNVWVRGSLSKYESDGVVQDFGIVHLGADYRINKAFIVGAMMQFDWAEEADPVANTAASGHGWMIGPYAVVRLHDNLIFDGRVAWGQSNNEVSPFGTYTDDFDTDRFLVRGQLTGDFDYNGWTVAPQVALTYIREKQHSYIDSNNILIGDQTVELGQLSFGPKISRSFQVENGTRLSPSISLKGIWDFRDTGILNIDTGTVSNGNGSDLTARMDVGLDIDFAQGTTISLDAFYTGIGDSGNEGYGGSVNLNVPF